MTDTDLHNTEKLLNLALKQVLKTNKIYSIDDLNGSTLMQLNKSTLAGFVENLTKQLNNNIELCTSAAGRISMIKFEQIHDQKVIIDRKETQLQLVKNTEKPQ